MRMNIKKSKHNKELWIRIAHQTIHWIQLSCSHIANPILYLSVRLVPCRLCLLLLMFVLLLLLLLSHCYSTFFFASFAFVLGDYVCVSRVARLMFICIYETEFHGFIQFSRICSWNECANTHVRAYYHTSTTQTSKKKITTTAIRRRQTVPEISFDSIILGISIKIRT